MKDIIFKYDVEQKCFDIDLDNPIGESINSKISLLLFTDCRCEEYELPKMEKSRRGFWANCFDKTNLGSKLWLLNRSKKTDSILNEVKSYCYQALEVLLLEKIIDDLKINTSFEKNILTISIETINKDGSAGNFTYIFGEK